MSADTTPYAVERQERLERACREARVELRVLPGPSVLEPGAVTPAARRPLPRLHPLLAGVALASAAGGGTDAAPHPRAAELPALRLPATALARAPARLARSAARAARAPRASGSRAGSRAGSAGYGEDRDDLARRRDLAAQPLPALRLHLGPHGARPQRGAARRGREPFARQLCWRDFHRQVLADRPDMPHADYRPRGDAGGTTATRLEAWRAGRTGYPIVDAGMRELAERRASCTTARG